MTSSNVTILTRTQYDSIKAKTLPVSITSTEEERLRLKQLSSTRTAAWPNTLQDQRKKREKSLQNKQAAEEAERERQDRIDAEIKAENRRIKIESANKMLFDDTDKVKGLHAKMLLSDVLQEREAQIAYRKRIEGLHRAREQEFLAQQKISLAVADAAEVEKKAAQKRRALDQRDVQNSQLRDMKLKILKEREEGKLEGDLIKKKAEEEASDQKMKEEKVRETAKKASLATKVANEALQAFKALERDRELQSMQAIKAYGEAKDAKAEERKRREVARAEAKEASRQRMVAIMERIFLAAKNESDARLNRDVKAAEDKRDADLAEQARIRREEWASIDRSRKHQLAQRQAMKEKHEAQDKAFALAWEDRLAALKKEEAEELAELARKNRAHLEFLQHQTHVKDVKAAKQKAFDEDENAARLFNVAEDDDLFQQYALVCLDEWKTQGKSTKPMELYLKKASKPSVTR